MSVKYLGAVSNIVTGQELLSITGVTDGNTLVTGDITWLKFKVENKYIFVSSKCVKVNLSWNTLNSFGVIFGKNIKINENEYICRSLSGATSNPPGTAGGEWDLLLVPNVFKFPTNDLTTKYTICQETTTNNYMVVRGNNDNINYYATNLAVTAAGTAVGWRPVLEVVNIAPKISIQDQNLGDILDFSNINYTVSDENNDTFAIVEKLDGVAIRTLENQVSGTQYILDLSNIWDSISYGKHTIEITVNDNKLFGDNTVTITFNKTKELTKPIPTTSSLKELVNHIYNIDKDVDYLKFKLSDNLTQKGVECSDTDKMSSLIDKIENLSVIKGDVTPGEDLFILFDKKEYPPTPKEIPIVKSPKVKINGGYRVYFTCGSINNIVIKYGVKHMRNNTVVSQKMFNYSSYAYTSYTYDFSDVRKDDTFEFYAVGGSSGTYLHMKDISVSCKIEI